MNVEQVQTRAILSLLDIVEGLAQAVSEDEGWIEVVRESLRLHRAELREGGAAVRVVEESRLRVDEEHVKLVRRPMLVLDDREVDGVRTIVVREALFDDVAVQGPVACHWRDDAWKIPWRDEAPEPA